MPWRQMANKGPKKKKTLETDAKSADRADFYILTEQICHQKGSRKQKCIRQVGKLAKASRRCETNKSRACHSDFHILRDSLPVKRKGLGLDDTGGYGHKPQNLISVMLHSSRNKRKSAGRQLRMPEC